MSERLGKNSNLGKYKMHVTLSSPDCTKKVRQNYEVFVNKDPDTYGNGCSMVVRNTDTEQKDYYDLRYESWFDTNNLIQSIVKFAFLIWTGKNGSWHIIDIRVGLA